MKQSVKNASNISKQLYATASGSRLYAQMRHEDMRDIGTSSMLKDWKKMHTKKGGGWVNETAEDDWFSAMDPAGIENIMNGFDFQERAALLQYWRRIPVGSKWTLTVEGQPFFTNEATNGLINYRRRCLNDVHCKQCLLNDLSVYGGKAYQRALGDPNQFMGQLVVPVYEGKKLAGVIELTTPEPEEDYADEFLRLSISLGREGLATKALTVKVTCGDTIRFPLLSNGINYLWENVTTRFPTVNHQSFLIKYVNRRHKSISISSDDDLKACIADSNNSFQIRMFIEPI
ncbi:hypothetical protein E3N88_30866 [Mikania micrantha]|uniref:PB1 domain-containing protein n=1 Tax=Mikania micrantha TaxID=192012 RepID=A0A5N6MNM8_9ASTR|nr:hypothetical protein E3N88_30866 [Mikania micrantha]